MKNYELLNASVAWLCTLRVRVPWTVSFRWLTQRDLLKKKSTLVPFNLLVIHLS